MSGYIVAMCSCGGWYVAYEEEGIGHWQPACSPSSCYDERSHAAAYAKHLAYCEGEGVEPYHPADFQSLMDACEEDEEEGSERREESR